jgi:hypothetical protein
VARADLQDARHDSHLLAQMQERVKGYVLDWIPYPLAVTALSLVLLHVHRDSCQLSAAW